LTLCDLILVCVEKLQTQKLLNPNKCKLGTCRPYMVRRDCFYRTLLFCDGIPRRKELVCDVFELVALRSFSDKHNFAHIEKIFVDLRLLKKNGRRNRRMAGVSDKEQVKVPGVGPRPHQ
jgi:hypothetical protein